MKSLSKKRELELLKESEEWESGQRGQQSVAVSGDELMADLQMISIRLPAEVISSLKTLAADEGLKYQPYVRSLLIKHVRESAPMSNASGNNKTRR